MYTTIRDEYIKQWGRPESEIVPYLSEELLKDFPNLRILIFPPSRFHKFWIYSTLGMFELGTGKEYVSEVYMFSEVKTNSIIEAFSNFMEYIQGEDIHYGKVFSCGNIKGSEYTCSHLFAAYPFPDGEGFHEIYYQDKEICFIWLVPITDGEASFITENGFEVFEDRILELSLGDFTWDRKPLV